MGNTSSFVQFRTMIGTGFDDGRYTGNHFLEMFYGGDDVANGRVSGRAIAPIETDGCAVGLFQSNALR
jgi:hypothetical protein